MTKESDEESDFRINVFYCTLDYIVTDMDQRFQAVKGICDTFKAILTYIDFKKAFDSVGHPQLIEALDNVGFDSDSLQYISSFYSKISTEILDLRANVRRGVMQGDPLPTLLFNTVLDQALGRLPQGVGVHLRGELIKYLAFTDDIVLAAATRVGLQAVIDALIKGAEEVGLTTGISKCATMGIVGDRARKTWDESEEQVEEACEVMSDAVDVTFEGDISTVLIPTSTPSTLSRHPQSSVPASSSSLKRPLFPLLEDTFRAKKQKAELAFWEAKIAAAEAERAAADAKRKAFELEAF
ncbi:uncharacterized protein [Macrobrachium rosenbergii]|uniref:uncharacterized protein n=1 Tax=Macrobrachium rosenbergii TaxID=79674 RepID=UPI0034D4E787